MSNFVGRMFEEHDQLTVRIEKLKSFILSDKYDELLKIDREDLKAQLVCMEGYFSILSRRVSRQCG